MSFATWKNYRLIITHKKQPSIATWLLFVLAVNISFVSYLFTENLTLQSLIDNANNVVDVPTTWIILLTLFFVQKQKRKGINFGIIDYLCLGATAGILIFWITTQKHLETNLATQLILTIAYAPTFKNLWVAKKNPESFWVWATILTASIIFLYLGIQSNKIIPGVYAFRSTTLVFILLLLMGRLEWRNRKTKKAE